MTGEASTSDRLGRSPRTSQASTAMISTAEHEIQTAPAAAAATGGIVVIRTRGYWDRLAVRAPARGAVRASARGAVRASAREAALGA
jgi:hypothetical protein